MAGFQFLHIETYSRKADKGGRTVSNVLDEAERRPGSCEHVEHPGEPEVVFGYGLDAVRAQHDDRVAEARSEVAGGKPRKLRTDQHTLLTAVMSHPVTMDQVRDDQATAAEVAVWQVRSIDWVRATWGDRLVSVVRHSDEGHPHLHAYLLSDSPGMKAKALHPGCSAKDTAKAEALAAGADARGANGRGDAAYKCAMRTMQDSYWEAVGLPSGLARLGPGRRRLDRGAWKAEQDVVTATAVALRVSEEAQAATADAQAKALSLGDRGRAFIAKAREAASAAKLSADAAEASRRDAEQAEAHIRQRVGSVSRLLAEVQSIRSELSQERLSRRVAEAERETYRARWAEADNQLQDARRLAR